MPNYAAMGDRDRPLRGPQPLFTYVRAPSLLRDQVFMLVRPNAKNRPQGGGL